MKLVWMFMIVVSASLSTPQGGSQGEADGYVVAGRLLDSGNFEQAAIIYERLLVAEPEMAVERRARVLNNLGFSRFRLNKVNLALQHYFEALALRPEYATCLNNVGAALIGQKRFAEALVYLERGYRSERSIKIVFNMFVAHYRLGHERQALAFIEEAMRLDSSYTEARLRAKNVKASDIDRLKKRIRY